jgi:hypothetical protein
MKNITHILFLLLITQLSFAQSSEKTKVFKTNMIIAFLVRKSDGNKTAKDNQT